MPTEGERNAILEALYDIKEQEYQVGSMLSGGKPSDPNAADKMFERYNERLKSGNSQFFAVKHYFDPLVPSKERGDYSGLTADFGEASIKGLKKQSDIVLVKPPFTFYYEGKPVSGLRFHRLVEDDVQAVLNEVLDTAIGHMKKKYGSGRTEDFYKEKAKEYIHELRLDRTSGEYHPKYIRNTNELSPHTWGVAIDIDGSRNLQYKRGKSSDPTKTTLPQWYVNIWKAHGFSWGGDYPNYPDPMHFEKLSL